jgi:hypothetical protein
MRGPVSGKSATSRENTTPASPHGWGLPSDRQALLYAATSQKLQKAKLSLPFCMWREARGLGANVKARRLDADRDDPRVRAIALGGGSEGKNAPRVCRVQRSASEVGNALQTWDGFIPRRSRISGAPWSVSSGWTRRGPWNFDALHTARGPGHKVGSGRYRDNERR